MNFLGSRSFLTFSRSDIHAELDLLGVSSEVHALVDDLELVPLVVNPWKLNRIRKLAFESYSSEVARRLSLPVVRNVYRSDLSSKEATGRLF